MMKNCQRHVLLLRSSVTKKKKKGQISFSDPRTSQTNRSIEYFYPIAYEASFGHNSFLTLALGLL